MGMWLGGRGLLAPVAPVLAAAVVIGAGPGTAGAAATCVGSAGARSENPGSGNDLNGAAVVSLCRAEAMGGYPSGTAEQTRTERPNRFSWQKVSSPSPGLNYNFLSGAAATSASNAWAVGSYDSGTGRNPGLIERWNGTAWKQVPSPNPGSVNNDLFGVAATSATSAWAVGFYAGSTGANRTLIERWNGKIWKQVPSPNPGAGVRRLTSVAAISATRAWAVGFYSSGTGVDRTLIARWNGKTWKQVPSPNPGTARNSLSGVAVTSATNAWAVGGYSNGSTYRTLIVHWNGKVWKQVPSPNSGSGNNEWSGVAATSAANAWAVGSYDSGDRTLIAHWNGTSWTKMPSPNPGSSGSGLSGVAATSTAGAWAVGSYVSRAGVSRTLIAHWNGTSWTKVPSPNPGSSGSGLSAVAATSAADAWALGTSGNKTLTLHCC